MKKKHSKKKTNKLTHSIYIGIIIFLLGIIAILLGERNDWKIVETFVGIGLLCCSLCFIIIAFAVDVIWKIFKTKTVEDKTE
jgi:Mn2+/Fe2+ NRAMP family transporter